MTTLYFVRRLNIDVRSDIPLSAPTRSIEEEEPRQPNLREPFDRKVEAEKAIEKYGRYDVSYHVTKVYRK